MTNTGSVPGKDVVEVYSPYTNGGIEKASANLITFDKTDMLEPGASQTLPLSFNDARTYSVAGRIDYTDGRSTDQAAPVSLFDFARGEIEYLSRADGFANFAAAPSMSMPEADKALYVNNSNYVIPTDPSAVMPTTGARNGMTIQELWGAPYDDERWEALLDNLTISEMNNMIARGGYQTAPAASIGKVATTDCDGPAACGQPGASASQPAASGLPEGTQAVSTPMPEITDTPAPEPGQTTDPEAGTGGRVLVAYFSATGSTRNVAGYIANALGAGQFELVPAEPDTSADLRWSNADSRVDREHDDESLRDVKLTPNEVSAIDWALDGMEMSQVFGGAQIAGR